jgi:hypothetical protein
MKSIPVREGETRIIRMQKHLVKEKEEVTPLSGAVSCAAFPNREPSPGGGIADRFDPGGADGQTVLHVKPPDGREKLIS